MALRFLTGGAEINICRVHDVPYGSFNMIAKRVIAAINSEMIGLIALPLHSKEELEAISRGFMCKSKGGIRGCIGALGDISAQVGHPLASRSASGCDF
jgi:hypothetical protein